MQVLQTFGVLSFPISFPKVLGTLFCEVEPWVFYFCGVFIFVVYSDLVPTSKL